MTALSVLENVLCLNKNQIHVDKIEDKVEVLHKDEDVSKGKGKVEFLDKADVEARRAVGGEVFIARDVTLIHARPYKRVQCVCPTARRSARDMIPRMTQNPDGGLQTFMACLCMSAM